MAEKSNFGATSTPKKDKVLIMRGYVVGGCCINIHLSSTHIHPTTTSWIRVRVFIAIRILYSTFASDKILIILSLRELSSLLALLAKKSRRLRRKSNWRFAWKLYLGNISFFRFPPKGHKISARRALYFFVSKASKLDVLPLGNLKNLEFFI